MHERATPFLCLIRNFLLGRVNNNPLRFIDQCAIRPGPPANLPPGPSHKVSGNYYFTRDGRREVTFPTMIVDASQAKAITAGPEETAAEATPAAAPRVKSKIPGAVFNYSQ